MKIVHVTPSVSAETSLKAMLKAIEHELRGKATAFIRQKEGRWVHMKHAGWINVEQTLGGVLVAEIRTKQPEVEWQLLQAFAGSLDRHLGERIASITISYR